jgi:nucleotide-binding universal stress UspA family protein
MITLNKVLVATDFSDVAGAALTYGSELAKRFGARLHVVHIAENAFMLNVGAAGYVADVTEIQREIDEEARRQIDSCTAGIEPRPTTAVISAGSSPAFGIVDYAKEHDIDLVVIGTHGRGGVTRMILGSVAEKVVRMAPCPVLTVHHPEHEFVVPDARRVEAVA